MNILLQVTGVRDAQGPFMHNFKLVRGRAAFSLSYSALEEFLFLLSGTQERRKRPRWTTWELLLRRFVGLRLGFWLQSPYFSSSSSRFRGFVYHTSFHVILINVTFYLSFNICYLHISYLFDKAYRKLTERL